MHAWGSHLIPISRPGSVKRSVTFAQPDFSHVARRGPAFSGTGSISHHKASAETNVTSHFDRPLRKTHGHLHARHRAQRLPRGEWWLPAWSRQASGLHGHAGHRCCLSRVYLKSPQSPQVVTFFSVFSALPNSGQAEHLTRSSFPAVSLLVSGTAGSPVMGTTGLRVTLCPGCPLWCHVLNVHPGGSSFCPTALLMDPPPTAVSRCEKGC